MGKIMKSGKVVLILGGRYSGRKGVVVKVIHTKINQILIFTNECFKSSNPGFLI